MAHQATPGIDLAALNAQLSAAKRKLAEDRRKTDGFLRGGLAGVPSQGTHAMRRFASVFWQGDALKWCVHAGYDATFQPVLLGHGYETELDGQRAVAAFFATDRK